MRILVTRADDRAAATVERLQAHGHVAVRCPVTEIVATGERVPKGPFAAVMATSARGLRFATAAALFDLRRLPFLAVGEETARAARELGFGDVLVGRGGVRSLMAFITPHFATSMPLLYLAGYDRKEELEANLAERGYRVIAVTVYQAKEVTTLTAEQIACLTRGRIDTVLHYSRRSAEIFCRLMRSEGLETILRTARHLCISSDAADPLRAMIGLEIGVAAEPAEASLLAEL
jgi:uroporphyrinogen-III synthase